MNIIKDLIKRDLISHKIYQSLYDLGFEYNKYENNFDSILDLLGIPEENSSRPFSTIIIWYIWYMDIYLKNILQMKLSLFLEKKMLKINEIYEGDSFKLLPKIDDECIDLVCVDPPYEIEYQNHDWDKKNSIDWNILLEEYYRILKPTGNLIVFQGWSNVSETKSILEKKFILNNWIIWDRIKGRGAKKNLVSTREDILWFSKTKNHTYNKIDSDIKKATKGMGEKNGRENRALSNVWTDIGSLVPWSKEKVKHPTQKPVKLMKRIITVWSNKGDLIIDNFCGSGSTLVAAKELERDFIGMELSKEYVLLSKKRVNETKTSNNYNKFFKINHSL